MTEYEPVIGLEIHAQLRTRTKMFCSCPAEFGAEPNTHVCPVCLGLPGALPVVNERAVEYAVKMGVATNCRIARRSVFARKNYFYPDCPKNYQITQYEIPLCSGGYMTAGEHAEKIRIMRIHLEEDAAKLVHPGGEADASYVDMNRAGVPLIEIVTEPDIRTPAQAARVAEKLRSILKSLDICDGNMEEGSLRCDVNVSVRKTGTASIGVSTEIKNLNSFKAVERALEFEIQTQTKTLRDGNTVSHMTLLWDAGTLTCREMRVKEAADDYRYFPDPDLRALDVPEELAARVRSEMPELPDAKADRFVTELGLPRYDANLLTDTRELADYFEAVAGACGDAKTASNWVMGEVLRELNERRVDIDGLRVTPERLARLIAA
ncbi:MAG: Asp-tRNA(Asn)/Glu-tRNA(Gln) amidotransferase subunit GatB, partial [bacterium]